MTDIDTATRIAVESARAVTDAYGPELAAKDAEITRLSADNTRLRALVEEMGKALDGVILVADRKTDEFDRARAARAKAKEQS